MPPRTVAKQKTSLFDIHILDRLPVLYRYREISLVVFALTSAATLIQGYTKVQRFQAQGRLIIENEPAVALPVQGSAAAHEDPQAFDAHSRTIKGRDLARRVVRKLHVENNPEFIGVADPRRASLGVVNGLKRRIVSLLQPGSTDGEPEVAGPPDEAILVGRLIDLVAVRHVPDSRLADVSLDSIDAQFAALAVNTLMEEYVADHLAPEIGGAPPRPDFGLRVASPGDRNTVRIVDRADVPTRPVSPAGPNTWLLALAIGLGSAIAVALSLDYMNDTIKTPEEIDALLKLPLLGLVPAVGGDTSPLLTSSDLPNEFAESFRRLRASLLSMYPDSGTKLLIVTSTQPLEGKTIVAANMATALAHDGARVLLIDADLRRPGLDRPFRLTNERGLAQVLNGQARVRDVIQRTADPNLLAITAGRTPQNPSELLSSERMKTLLANLAHGAFDWIVIDTPPVLAAADAVVLAPSAAGVVYVIGARMTRRRLAERALTAIVSARPHSVCAVLNKVEFSRNSRPYKNGFSSAAV